LILAAATVSLVLGENGIISRAQDATNKTNEAGQNEQNALNTLDEDVDELLGIVRNPEGWSDSVTAIKTDEGTKVPIPNGFTKTSDTNSIEEGIVIKDSSGNEFVWVPCTTDGANGTVKYEKWCTTGIAYNNASISNDTLPSGVSSEEEQITKYGGFYIARYEAGIPDSLSTAQTTANSTARNVSGVPVSKQNAVPWNYINYTNAKANAESMYSSGSVQSGLLTGTMWDTTMKWLQNAGYSVTDSTAWGNYNNAEVTGITEYSTNYGEGWTSAITKPSGSSYILKTGNSSYTNRKNIYDLAGNVCEWTNENYSSSRVGRGRLLHN